MVWLFLSVVLLPVLMPEYRKAVGILTVLLIMAGIGPFAYGQRQDAPENRIKPADIRVRLGQVGPGYTYADVIIENTSIYTVASMMVNVYVDRAIPCTGFWVESQDIDCAHQATTPHSLSFESGDGNRGGLGPHQSVTYRIRLDEWAKEKDTVGVVLRPTVNWVRADTTK